MYTKSIFVSKTFWFNFIVFILALVSLPDFISILPAGVLPYLPFVTVIGNMILRTYFPNTTPVSITGGYRSNK